MTLNDQLSNYDFLYKDADFRHLLNQLDVNRTDLNLPPEYKESLILELNKIQSVDDSQKLKIIHFMRRNQMVSNSYCFGEKEKFYTLMTVKALKAWLTILTDRNSAVELISLVRENSTPSFCGKKFNKWLNHYYVEKLDPNISLSNIPLKQYTTWVFATDFNSGLLELVKLAEEKVLQNRLGLENFDKRQDYILFNIDIPLSTVIYKPTIFDAELGNTLFKIGGKTRPIDTSLNGIHEWVLKKEPSFAMINKLAYIKVK